MRLRCHEGMLPRILFAAMRPRGLAATMLKLRNRQFLLNCVMSLEMSSNKSFKSDFWVFIYFWQILNGPGHILSITDYNSNYLLRGAVYTQGCSSYIGSIVSRVLSPCSWTLKTGSFRELEAFLSNANFVLLLKRQCHEIFCHFSWTESIWAPDKQAKIRFCGDMREKCAG